VGLIRYGTIARKARQFGATEESIANQRPDIQAQISATKQQIDKAEKRQNVSKCSSTMPARKSIMMMRSIKFRCSTATKAQSQRSTTAQGA
jgi:hypothetical protein